MILRRISRLSKSFTLPALLLATTATLPAQMAAKQASDTGLQELSTPAYNDYPLSADSKPQPGVPQGKTFHFEWSNSKIFPNTTRTITVYIPAQYQPDQPACTFVFLDGLGFNAPTVLDNLIAQHAMPITIAIGVSPGKVSSAKSENPRFDRSLEFDTMSDRLARLLLNEIIPAVEQHQTPDGKAIHLINHPDARAIAGTSTGGIGSFTVAWQHPEAFHRVFSGIGTFVGMRGGQDYYVQVRKTEPKPLRIFLEDGANDEWAGAEMGDWWMSNLTMNRALEFAGYDVRHVWGANTHNSNHAAAVFPDAVRWLWRDWPQPIQAKPPANRVLKSVLQEGETWTLLGDSCSATTDLSTAPDGRLLLASPSDPTQAQWFSTGSKLLPCEAKNDALPTAIGPDGTLFQAQPYGGIDRLSPTTDTRTPYKGAEPLKIKHLIARHNGDLYALTQTQQGEELWLLPAAGQPRKLESELKEATGLAFSPDGLWLFVSQKDCRFGLSYRVQDDGSLDAREPFYVFDLPAAEDESGATQIAMDSKGQAYVATALGIQIFDRNGRVAAILPLPGGAVPTGIAFGGSDFTTLYVSAGGKLYARKLQVAGAPPWAKSIQLPHWGAG